MKLFIHISEETLIGMPVSDNLAKRISNFVKDLQEDNVPFIFIMDDLYPKVLDPFETNIITETDAKVYFDGDNKNPGMPDKDTPLIPDDYFFTLNTKGMTVEQTYFHIWQQILSNPQEESHVLGIMHELNEVIGYECTKEEFINLDIKDQELNNKMLALKEKLRKESMPYAMDELEEDLMKTLNSITAPKENIKH